MRIRKVGTHLAKLHLSLIGFGFSDCDTKRGGESIEHQRIRRPLFYFALSTMTKYPDFACAPAQRFCERFCLLFCDEDFSQKNVQLGTPIALLVV